MLEKCIKENFEKLVNNRIVLIVGAGNIGKKFIKEYNEKLSGKIVVFDNSLDKQVKGIEVASNKFAVFPVNVIDTYDNEQSVIVITSMYYNELYKQLMDFHFADRMIFVYPFIESREKQFELQIRQCLSDYYYHNHFDLTYRNDFIEKEYAKYKDDGRMVLPYLPLYLTTKCSLNCDKCNNLIPHFKETNCANDIAADVIEASLSRILDCVQELIFCELVGGEPFLYNELEEILDFVGNNKKIRQIVIVTNGTIIPQEKILHLLKKYNVLVRISDYGLFEKIAKLVITLEKYDINVRVLQDMKWNDPGNIEKRGRREDELFFQYNKCIFSIRCKYLTGDKLYTCARIASLGMLGIYNGDEDVLFIDDSLTEAKLKDFYLHNFGRGCDYCDLCTIDLGNEIPAAVQRGNWQIKHSQYTIIRNDYLERLKGK